MQKIQNQLKTVSKSLAAHAQKVEKLSEQINTAQPAPKAAAPRKAPAKKAKATAAPAKAPAKKAAAAATGAKTVLDTVYDVIKRAKKGVTVAQLKQKTNLDARQLSNALYKLTKKGQVFAPSRGLYLKK
jgi:predicted Rossmann fold nucleotide-binding protein DprA/Smf involved in DNA uptake